MFRPNYSAMVRDAEGFVLFAGECACFRTLSFIVLSHMVAGAVVRYSRVVS